MSPQGRASQTTMMSTETRFSSNEVSTAGSLSCRSRERPSDVHDAKDSHQDDRALQRRANDSDGTALNQVLFCRISERLKGAQQHPQSRHKCGILSVQAQFQNCV
eukprot:TRINITY_DN6342_c0_g1_i4.p2 TRINITY_DN6342_c0_g1~~TRINITY_DN6342_c0_g1_i4.p2  ORF type:complete len:105 (+),score=14.39 TRINITY_DN6342_c0_g1_i4:758-1072(+)